MGTPAAHGIGPKKADTILDYAKEGTPPERRLWTMWAGVLRAFEAKKLPEQYALGQARIARICRHTDYDFAKKEVILWNPPAKP